MTLKTDFITGSYVLETPGTYPGGFQTQIKPEMIVQEHRQFFEQELARLVDLISGCAKTDARNKLQRELKALLNIQECNHHG